MITRLIIFLAINFFGLYLGGLATSKGVSSEWYSELNKAPWTPPGWVFGAAWTLIMIFFSIYLTNAYARVSNQKIFMFFFTGLFLLNLLWNPVFFYYHNLILGQLIISVLLILLIVFSLYYQKETGFFTLLLLPYILWLIIANSLNLYILLKN